MKPKLEDLMRAALAARFADSQIVLTNQSHLHSGHSGDNGSGESHFKLCIISHEFQGMSQIQRHRIINTILHDFFKNSLHAMEIKAYTFQENKNL